MNHPIHDPARPGAPLGPEHPLNGIHALLVDLDGTLVDTLGDFTAAVQCMLDELGLPRVEAADVERWIGKGSENLMRQVLAQVVPDEPQRYFEAALAAYQRHYLDINGRHATVYPGAREALQGFADMGLPMACLTNKPMAFALPLLDLTGLAGFFQVVRGGDSFPQKKPHPMPLLKTCELLCSDPGRTLMIGDSVNDALAAQAAGCPVVLVRYGYNHGAPVDAIAALAHLDRLDTLLPQRP